MSENVTEDSVTVQRSPRYFRFMLAGAILFAVVALILTFAFPAQPGYDRGQIFGFLLLGGIVLGIAVGAVIALIVGWVTGRRARTVAAAHTTTRTE
jgi:flagellar biosynthesis protein FliR